MKSSHKGTGNKWSARDRYSAGKEEGGFIQQYDDLIESKRETGAEESDKTSEHRNKQPRPRGPVCHTLEKSGPMARSNNIPVLNGLVNTIDLDQN